MARKFHKPQRMCVVCRQRSAQESLLRLQCHERLLTPYQNQGRSFYICFTCIDTKSCAKVMAKQCKSGEIEALMKQLKEFTVDVR